MSLKIDGRPGIEGLTDKHIEIIGKILAANLPASSKICIKRCDIYNKLKEVCEINMELYRFERELSEALNEGRLPEYGTKPGKGGGVCRIDSNVKKNAVIVDGKAFICTKVDAINLIKKVLGGTENDEGTVQVGNKKYVLPKTIHTERLLQALLSFLHNKGNK